MTGSVHEKLPGVVAFPGHASLTGRNAVPLATACPVIGTRRAEIATARGIPGTERRTLGTARCIKRDIASCLGDGAWFHGNRSWGIRPAVARRAGATRPTLMKRFTGKFCKE